MAKLNKHRITSLTPIEFDWEMQGVVLASGTLTRPGSTSTGKRNIIDETTDHKAAMNHKDFFHRVHILKLYKEKHGHLKDLTIAGFCVNVRRDEEIWEKQV